MTPDELEQQLRTLLAEEGFAWILRQVDETIAAGKPEDVSVKKRARSSRRQSSWDPRYQADEVSAGLRAFDQGFQTTPAAAESPGSHIKTDAYTAAERASLILQAMQRVLVDLPKAHKEQTALLAQESDSPVRGVAFLPDDNAPDETTIVIAREGQQSPSLPDSEGIDHLLRALAEGLTQ